MGDRYLNIAIAKFKRIQEGIFDIKYNYDKAIKNRETNPIPDRSISIIKSFLTRGAGNKNVYTDILKNNQLLTITIIILHAQSDDIVQINKILFGEEFTFEKDEMQFSKYYNEYPIIIDKFNTKNYLLNVERLKLIRKIIHTNLIISKKIFNQIKEIFSPKIDMDIKNMLHIEIVITILLSNDINNKISNSGYYERIIYLIKNKKDTSEFTPDKTFTSLYAKDVDLQDVILHEEEYVKEDKEEDKEFITTITATAEQYSIKELEIAIKIFNEILQKNRDALISGGKKKTKYNIFLSKELKRLKKINPDKDYKLRFKEAVNNWKNKK